MCPQSCQDDITCMIAACSDSALVGIVCDEQIDTTAYPKLAMTQGLPYADLDLADVPEDKKAQDKLFITVSEDQLPDKQNVPDQPALQFNPDANPFEPLTTAAHLPETLTPEALAREWERKLHL